MITEKQKKKRKRPRKVGRKLAEMEHEMSASRARFAAIHDEIEA